MKRSMTWTAALWLCLAGCQAASEAPAAAGAGPSGQPSGSTVAPPRRGLMQAVMIEKGPPIDGTLDSPIWASCPPLVLGECTSEKAGPAATTARVLFGPTHLYVAWECAEADTDSLKQAPTQRDGQVWADDCVELFVTGDTREGYFHFAVNPRGALFDARSTAAKKDDASYDSGAAVKAAVQKGSGWTVTMSVPLKELGAYVGANQTWVMNLNRTKPGPGPQALAEWSWAIMATNDYHQVLDYGQVQGVNVPRREDGVTRTATPPPPPASYDKGERAGSVIVYRHSPEMTIPDRGQGIAKAIDLNILGSEGLKVAFLAKAPAGVDSIPFNMADRRSNDNTTSKAYRLVGQDWRPLLYFCDRFRYNAQVESTVSRNVQYTNLRFHSMAAKDGRGELCLRDFTIYRGEDTDPPAAPADLKAAAGDEGVKLTWRAPADNVGIALYAVSRADADGKFVKVGQSHLGEYLDRPAKPGSFSYRVLAVDFQDNVGPWSKPAAAKIEKGFAPPEPSRYEQDRLGYAQQVRAVHQAGAGKVNKGVVLCFGDSLTGATNYRVYTEAALGRYRVEAFGRAGWRTDAGRKVIEGDLEKVNPEFCLILYGTNNQPKTGKPLEQAMDDMLFIATACRKRGTVPIIGTIPPRGFSDPASKPEAEYNAALVKMCRENKIPVAYIFEGLQAQPDRRTLLAGDGVHFVTGGWEVVGPAWAEAMGQVKFVLLDRPD